MFALAGAATLVLGLAACGSVERTEDDEVSGVEVSGQWARTSPMNAADGAAYMTITSEFGDTLVSAQVSSEIARAVQIHETKPVEDVTDGTGMTEDSAMGGDTEMEMVQIESIEIPEGGEVTLEPGGLHLMLIGLEAPLEVGSEFELTLTFATAGKLTLDVPVLDEAP
jgi:hypothetical protein